MFVRAYKHSGLQGTKDHDSLIVQGSAVGGSTVINNAIFLRADLDRVLRGLGGAPERPSSARRSRPPTRSSSSALHVSDMPPELANGGANVFLDGCAAAGIRGEYLQHNRDQLHRLRLVQLRLPLQPQDLDARHLHPVGRGARGAGARPLPRRRGRREHRRPRAAACASSATGASSTIDADRVVVCAGAIGSSGVLLRSGIDLDGRVGRGLHMLGGLFVTAEMEEPVDGFDGIGLCCIAHAGRGDRDRELLRAAAGVLAAARRLVRLALQPHAALPPLRRRRRDGRHRPDRRGHARPQEGGRDRLRRSPSATSSG